MSKNKKKKLKKKEKQKQKTLELTQQQIQVRKQNQFLITQDKHPICDSQDAEKQKQNLLNLNKLSISEDNEVATNGHKPNSIEDSDEENPTEETPPAAAAATAATTTEGDETKPTDENQPDPINRRKTKCLSEIMFM